MATLVQKNSVSYKARPIMLAMDTFAAPDIMFGWWARRRQGPQATKEEAKAKAAKAASTGVLVFQRTLGRGGMVRW